MEKDSLHFFMRIAYFVAVTGEFDRRSGDNSGEEKYRTPIKKALENIKSFFTTNFYVKKIRRNWKQRNPS
jgi:hypothetical protein